MTFPVLTEATVSEGMLVMGLPVVEGSASVVLVSMGLVGEGVGKGVHWVGLGVMRGRYEKWDECEINLI